MSEKDIENLILEYLQVRGIFAFKNQSVGIYDPRTKRYRKSYNKFHINGTSDVLGILPDGRFLAIEVKTKKTKTRASEAQLSFIDNINKNGGVAFVAWDLDIVIERLGEALDKAA